MACEVTMSVTIERLAHPEPGLDVKHAIQSPDTQKTFFDKRTESTDFTPTKVSFGSFRLLPTQFFLLEGDEPVSTFFASDEHGGLRIAAVCAVVAAAARARFDPDSLRAGPGLRVARRERTER
jgi:hypothetical protein